MVTVRELDEGRAATPEVRLPDYDYSDVVGLVKVGHQGRAVKEVYLSQFTEHPQPFANTLGVLRIRNDGTLAYESLRSIHQGSI